MDILCVILIIMLMLFMALFIGGEIVFRSQIRLCDAIFEYQKHHILNGKPEDLMLVDYDDIYGYTYCLLRPHLWRAQKQIHEDKYRLIEPFLEGRK